MPNKIISFLFLAVIFSSCCKKPACIDEYWLTIPYRFEETAASAGNVVRVYTLVNGIKVDSTFFFDRFDATRELVAFKFPDDEAALNRSFRIEAGQTFFIKLEDIFFKEVEDECNDCGKLFNKKKKKELTDFTYSNNGNLHHFHDTIVFR